ncbi:hypothetical protein V3W47_18920 [Deinococcus sp. YIM 134068]|uniref:hypothetical protein n=1 Tax=Deinococcus lichenicola TaxID=3118910 RepID=UPI002F93A4B4
MLRRYENDPGLDAYLLPIVKLARFYSTTVEDLLTDPDPTIPKHQFNKKPPTTK